MAALRIFRSSADNPEGLQARSRSRHSHATEPSDRSAVASASARTLLDVVDLRAGYGKKEVLHGISFQLRENEVTCLLGHNGAGKSTTMRAVVGGVRASAGRILLNGQEITRSPVAERLQQGIAYVEPRGVLPGLTVRDNLLLARRAVRSRRSRRGTPEVLDLFPDLQPRLSHHAGALSGGQRQMLALAMALVISPSVLMLDEPLLGLAPSLAERLLDAIRDISAELGNAILLVEQNVRAALELSQRAYVLRAGELSEPMASDEVLRKGDLWSII